MRSVTAVLVTLLLASLLGGAVLMCLQPALEPHPAKAEEPVIQRASDEQWWAWLKGAQLPTAMRGALGGAVLPVPPGRGMESLAAHLTGDCTLPAAPTDPLTPLRDMRCSYDGKMRPPRWDEAPATGLDETTLTELRNYFDRRLDLGTCADAAACKTALLSGLPWLRSAYSREDLVLRWWQKFPEAATATRLDILGAFLEGPVSHKPRPEMLDVLAALDGELAKLSPRAALGLLRYAEKQLTEEQVKAAAVRAAQVSDPALRHEAAYYQFVALVAGGKADLVLQSLARGGPEAKPWFSKGLYRRCRGHFYARRYADAAVCFRVVEEQNQPDERDLAIWFQGKAAWKLDKVDLARSAWQRLLETGSDETGGEAAYLLGRHYLEKGNRAEAQTIASLAEARFAFGPYTGDLLAMLGGVPTDPRRLHTLWQHHPHSLGVAGLVEKNGTPPDAAPASWTALPPFEPQTPAETAALVLLLADEPQAAMAVVDLQEQDRDLTRWRSEHRLLGAWAQAQWGDYLTSVKTVERLWLAEGYQGVAKTGLYQALLYPLYYLPEALAAHEENGIPVPFLYGIMRQESRFMHRIRSRSGAIGLSQIMPSTGKAIAKWLDEGSTYQPAALEDPAMNLRYGSRYLLYLQETFGEDPRLMAAGYNGGPGNVNRWLKKNGYDQPWTWVEQIPLDETRDYVKKVLHNAWMYRHLYPQWECGQKLCTIDLAFAGQ